MDSSLSPREIQARIRAGASIADVAEEAGVPAERIEGFALPVVAEREHVARTALASTVRRRGDGTVHRRLGDLIRERLQVRGVDADTATWDAWRQPDRTWRLVGRLEEGAAPRCAEFVFDPRGRFSVADNSDARWMIGEEVHGDPDNENTVDFDDELALVRATQPRPGRDDSPRPGDDVPATDERYDDTEHTSPLDDLYDMLSGISEDSVRIYVGLEDPDPEASDDVPVPSDDDLDDRPEDRESVAPSSIPGTEEAPSAAPEPTQEPLVEDPHEELPPARKPGKKRRAQVPSWDEIMFGGPTGK